MSQTQTKRPPGRSPEAGQQAASSRGEHQRGPQRKNSSSRESLDQEKDGSKRRAAAESQQHRTGPGKDSGQRLANGKCKPPDDRSKESPVKKESSSFKGVFRRRGSIVSPREGKGREDTLFHVRKGASVDGNPGSPQSPKGPISPGDWKLPSSGRILSEAEILRDPL